MKLTPKCLQFIKDHEGFRGEAYLDSVGVWTIGYGSARTFRGQPIYPGMTCTEQEASDALEEDIPKYQTFLTFFNRGFNSNQVGALTSFCYNVGGGVFVNDGWNPSFSDKDITDSMNNYHRPPEIIGRRNDEVALYNTPPDGDDGSAPDPGQPPNPDPDPPRPGDSALTDKMKKMRDSVIQFIEEALTKDAYTFSQGHIWANSAMRIEKTYTNRLHVTLSPSFLEELKNKMTIENTGQGGDNRPPKPPPNPPGEGAHPVPDNQILKAIHQWCLDRQGQSIDFDGFPPSQPFQCVDVITSINQELNLGLNLAGPYASVIWANPLPAGWHKIQGNASNDAEGARIWNEQTPDGAIVWFLGGAGGYGHVAVKNGAAWNMLGQNQPQPFITSTNLDMGGAGLGYAGAWVPDGAGALGAVKEVEDQMNFPIKNRFGDTYNFQDYVAGMATDLALLLDVARKIEEKINVSRETKGD